MSNLSMKQELTQQELQILQSEYENKKKSTLISYLLWYFLGLFGMHQFYLGNPLQGILYLVLLTIGSLTAFILIGFFILIPLGIWWLIDAFLIPSYIQKLNEKVEKEILQNILNSRS